MKKQKILSSLLVLSSITLLIGCNNSPQSSTVPTSTTTSEETVNVVFENKTVVYDGKAHSLSVENLPEGWTVTYSDNEFTLPGKHFVTATITDNNGKVTTKVATLVIEKMESVLTAEEIQEAFAYGGVSPTYSLNNAEQSVSTPVFYRPGVYQVELFAEESNLYKESNHIVVTFTVKEGNDLGVEFASKEFIYDGSQKSIEATNVPSGYRVEYENNIGVNKGQYNARCNVIDANNQVVLSLNAIMTIDYEKNQEFEDYLDQFFADYLTGDYLAINIFTENSENFGIIRDVNDQATWYTYQTLPANYKEEAYQEMLEYRSYLLAFEDDPLSNEQQISYNLLEEFFNGYIEQYSSQNYEPLIYLSYINQFGGYAADFGTYMESYTLRNEQDVKDVLSYLNSLPAAFDSYLTYANDRVIKGYPLSDYTLNGMIGYLNDVTSQGDDYYLTEYLKNKIDGCTFLTDVEKADYKLDIEDAMKNSYMVAFENLSTGLEKFKGKCETTGYWSSYGEVGKETFTNDLKSLLGIKNLDLDEYGTYLETKLNKYLFKINSTVNNLYKLANTDPQAYNAFMSYLNGNSLVGIKDPNEMINYLKEFAKTIVPELKSDPEISIKYMDDSVARVSNAVAYYMKSALDSDNKEYITLNKLSLSNDYNSTLSTMAHEGYPGHLYAYVYSKESNLSNINKIMTSTAHAEGWATYVQLKLWEYIKTNNNSNSASEQKAVELYCDYMYYNDLLGYLAYTFCDYNIHINGWGVDDIASLFDRLGFDSNAAEDVYLTLIETPVSYAAYGYGISYFVDLHENARSQLGDLYDEVEFNEVIHSHGWCSFDELEKITDQYINDALFIYNQK